MVLAMQDKFINIVLLKRKEMLQLGVAKTALLPSVNRCLYVFLFLFVCFFKRFICIQHCVLLNSCLLKELVECLHQTVFSEKMLLLNDVFVLSVY